MDAQSIKPLHVCARPAGRGVTLLCAYRLPYAQLDVRFAALTLITVLLGSRITIKIPGARGQISVSDTFIFLAMLMVGVEGAVVLAAAEALSSSIRFSKKTKVRSSIWA